jgi:transcription elongation GreA/GreB family factor
MTAKVTETIDRIPTLNTSLADIFDFDGKCLDPLAIEIIVESLNYALETSVRRLESVAKVNPNIQRNAVETVLPAVKTLKLLIANAPKCDVSALDKAEIRPVPPPRKPRAPRKETKAEPKAEVKAEVKPETVTSAPEIMAASVTKLQDILKEEPKKKKAEKTEKVKPTKIKSTSVSETEEARIIGTMTPDGQAKMKQMKLGDVEAYERVLEDMAGISTASPVKIIKGTPILPKAEKGQIVSVTMTTADGDVEKRFLLVDEKVGLMASQQPEEAGVTKLPDTSSIGRAILGKSAGESVFMEIEGQKVKTSITAIKEGRLMPVAVKPPEPPPIKLLGTVVKEAEAVVQVKEKTGEWGDYVTIKDQADAYNAERILKSGWPADDIPASDFRIRIGGATPKIISGQESVKKKT